MNFSCSSLADDGFFRVYFLMRGFCGALSHERTSCGSFLQNFLVGLLLREFPVRLFLVAVSRRTLFLGEFQVSALAYGEFLMGVFLVWEFLARLFLMAGRLFYFFVHS